VAIVSACAWGYGHLGQLPAAAGILYGVKPVVIAVVVQALWHLGRTALRGRGLTLLALCAAAANALGGDELAVLAGAALAAALAHAVRNRIRPAPPGARAGLLLPPLVSLTAGLGATGSAAAGASAAGAVGAWPLFAFFLKVGSVLYGSGYVLLAFLRGGLVHDRGWLQESQLLDAVAIGQVTPGPLFTTATFIGYLLAGAPGAAAATAGIFLPAFVFVAISGPLVPRLRRSPLAGAVLDGVNSASLALMAVVTAQLATSALVDGLTLALAAASAVALFGLRINSSWLVVAGALVGVVASR
jgi:chromate transporter